MMELGQDVFVLFVESVDVVHKDWAIYFTVLKAKVLNSSDKTVAIWMKEGEHHFLDCLRFVEANFVHETEEDARNHALILSDMYKDQGHTRFLFKGTEVHSRHNPFAE